MQGVLDTEVVLTFQSSSEMMAATCLFAVAKGWCDEPIRPCIDPPRGKQVREYMATRGRCHSGTKAQMLGGMVVAQSSLSESHPEGGPQLQLHLSIRDLNDAHLRQELEELHLETARREGMAPLLG